MLLSTREYEENGVTMIEEIYGADEEHPSASIRYAKPTEGAEQPPEYPEPEATQLDRIEAQTAYIAMMMDGGEI